MKRIARLVACLPLLLFLWACGKKIGDECQTQFDCNDEDDSRSCDISQPGGYCTIEGCDERSCPEEANCVRFFPRAELLNRTCTPTAPDRGASECLADELCLDAGRCAPRATELRRCVLRCGDDGDCRDGYQCRPVGGPAGNVVMECPAGGTGCPDEQKQPVTAMPLTSTPGETLRYCAPRISG